MLDIMLTGLLGLATCGIKCLDFALIKVNSWHKKPLPWLCTMSCNQKHSVYPIRIRSPNSPIVSCITYQNKTELTCALKFFVNIIHLMSAIGHLGRGPPQKAP